MLKSKSAEKRKRKSESKHAEKQKKAKLSNDGSPDFKKRKVAKNVHNSNGGVDNSMCVAGSDVEEEVESMAKREVDDELVPNVEAEKKKAKKNKKGQKIPTLIPLEVEEDEADGSVSEGRKCFEWMINPCKSEQFFRETFEKRPLHIKRVQSNYYKNVFSTKAFDDMLREKVVLFGKNLDVTSYTDGKRETHNPDGRAYGPGK